MYISYASSIRLVNTEVRIFSLQHFIFVELLKLHRIECQEGNTSRYFSATCLMTSVADKTSVVNVLKRSL